MHDDYVIRVLGPIDVLGPSGGVAVGGRHRERCSEHW